MKGSLRHILVVALVATVALGASSATGAAAQHTCKRKTAKKCKNKRPIARFTFTPAPAGSASKFNARRSHDPDGRIVRYRWSFGATGRTASHTWSASGTYRVTLTVKDNRGAIAKATKTVVVPPPPSPPDHGTLTITPSVPADRAQLIREGWSIGQSYLPEIGAPTNWRVDLYAAASVPEMETIYQGLGYDPADVPRYMPDGGGAFDSHGDHVFIVPAGTSYDSSSPVRHRVVVVHEMWHTVQYTLAPNMFNAGSDDMPADGPVWLREGSAEFVGYSGVADSGVDASSFRGEMLSMAKGQYATVALQDTATQSAQSSVGYATYDLGFFATELLTKTNGMASLTAYWAKIGAGTPWRDAFQQAFGRTVDQFYTEFASYRASL
jgi:PKD repeat protein